MVAKHLLTWIRCQQEEDKENCEDVLLPVLGSICQGRETRMGQMVPGTHIPQSFFGCVRNMWAGQPLESDAEGLGDLG
jgi:hypothetical protein